MFQYSNEEVDALRAACRQLADGQRKQFALHEQPWVKAMGGCAFIWQSAPADVGVRMPRPGDPFFLALSDEGWREVEGKLLPFAQGGDGFNWLTMGGDVEVLISGTGSW